MLSSYNVIWDKQSRNAGESMPTGGYDTGVNVWVEKNELYLYMAQSGAFDERGQMAKAGRIHVLFSKNPFKDGFRQELIPGEGCIRITGQADGNETVLDIWADVGCSVVHVDMQSQMALSLRIIYETWRDENSTFENKNKVFASDGEILFYHRNTKTPFFDMRVAEQGIESIREWFPNVEKNRTFGGILYAPNTKFVGTKEGKYTENVFKGYILDSVTPVCRQNVTVFLHQNQTQTPDQWIAELRSAVKHYPGNGAAKAQALRWWKDYWDRSYVHVKPSCTDTRDKDWQCGRNYQLFRYMLAVNAYGEYPTKFNGSLFTVDPTLCQRREGFGSVYPDDRDWGGLIFTAQNQRLVYWPMLKNGDFEMMSPQFRFYTRILPGIKKRTEHFFEIKDCACYPEQIDANGLSAFYGKYGLDFPLQVRYHHVESLEFGFMILQYHLYSGADISEYMDFIESVIRYYDLTYTKLDERGKRIIFPSTALETFHAAQNINVWGRAGAEAANYNADEVAAGNPADVIAALDNTLRCLISTEYGSAEERKRWTTLLSQLPPIPREQKNGYEVIAPVEFPKKYEMINCEIPQLNTVYPYNVYGLNKDELSLAVNTYHYAWENEHQLLHISWHQNGIFAARLGLVQEARKYMWLKMGDAINRRFPTFWGPGHDYVPDHNWGGSGMIGMQEMLMQCFGDDIYLLPAWPKDVDVEFKLYALDNTEVEVSYIGGKLEYTVSKRKNVIVCI